MVQSGSSSQPGGRDWLREDDEDPFDGEDFGELPSLPNSDKAIVDVSFNALSPSPVSGLGLVPSLGGAEAKERQV